MLKKLMIGSMGFLFLSSATLFSYRALEPKAATGIEESYLSAAQSTDNLRSVEPADNARPQRLLPNRHWNPDCIISISAVRTTTIALISTNMSSSHWRRS